MVAVTVSVVPSITRHRVAYGVGHINIPGGGVYRNALGFPTLLLLTGMVAATVLVASSIADTVPSNALATYTEPASSSAATPSGKFPTVIMPITEKGAGELAGDEAIVLPDSVAARTATHPVEWRHCDLARLFLCRLARCLAKNFITTIPLALSHYDTARYFFLLRSFSSCPAGAPPLPSARQCQCAQVRRQRRH